MSASHHLLRRGPHFILLGLLSCWFVAANASSSEQNLRKRNRESTWEMIVGLSWLPGLSPDLSSTVRNWEWTDVPQYANWKTKRKNSEIRELRSERYLEQEDDEVLFDSNGMPIQLDDDHDVFDVGDGGNAIDIVNVGDKPNSSNRLPPENHAGNTNSQTTKSDLNANAKNPVEEKPNKINSNSNQASQSNVSAPASAGTENRDNHKNPTFNEENQETTINTQSVTHNTKLFNNTHHNSANDSPPADTIFDDIFHGFSFAFILCICIICLHKACRYACIRSGVLPDDRVVEARWRRLQLKNKRAYFNPHAPPPMDTRSLGKWFDQRDRMYPDGYAGIWDSSAERSVGSWDEGSECDIAFDDDGIQLSAWDKDDASSAAAELEYGEGDELEDKSHDERLFDLEDGGAGMKKEANKFFDGHARKNHVTKKLRGQSNNSNVIPQRTESDDLQKGRSAAKKDISDDSFFNALQSTSRQADLFEVHAKSENKADVSAFASQDVLQRQDHSDNPKNYQTLRDHECDIDEEFQYDDSMLSDDRGYDEESDLLGLRSESPPPLDLEEIEKKLREDMENAKSYY